MSKINPAWGVLPCTVIEVGDTLLREVAERMKALLRTPDGSRKAVRVLGVDALVIAAVAPALMPVPHADADRFALFAPGTVFLNPAAQALLAGAASGAPVPLQVGQQLRALQRGGTVSAGGGPLAVMDIGAAQDLFGRGGQLSRIDIRLAPGADREAVVRALALPGDVAASLPGDAAQRVSNLSRAYRVNLTVLALVALFTGAFLVFSILSLSVARRAPQLALLGVLGLSARGRLAWMLAESALIGLAGSVLGLALGTGLAALALRLLAGDLGGAYFPVGGSRALRDAFVKQQTRQPGYFLTCGRTFSGPAQGRRVPRP